MIQVEKVSNATCHYCRETCEVAWRIHKDKDALLTLCEQGMRELEWAVHSADFKHQYIAGTQWSEEDVKEIRKSWSLERCRRELERNVGYLKDRQCEEGWDILNILLPMEHEDEQSN